MATVNGHADAFNPMKLHRREFQRVAVQTIDAQAGALAALQDGHAQTREFVADLSGRLDTVTLETRQRLTELEAFRAMTAWQRLRWLVGR